MQVSEIDNVKIYNLSVGKSIPDVRFSSKKPKKTKYKNWVKFAVSCNY